MELSHIVMAWSAIGGLILLWLTWRSPHLGGLRWIISVIVSRSFIGALFNWLEAPLWVRVLSGHFTLGLAIWGFILWLLRQR